MTSHVHRVTSRSPPCHTRSGIRPCVHVCLLSFKPSPFSVPPDPAPFAFHLSQMCCVLTDVRNIFPVPASTWASVSTVTPCTRAAVCSCLIPRLCADSPPPSDMYFFYFHTSAEEVLIRSVSGLSEPIADVLFFAVSPFEIDEGVVTRRPSTRRRRPLTRAAASPTARGLEESSPERRRAGS